MQPQILEAIRIRYLIVRAGGMANKSNVEDVMILRGTVPDRCAGHDIMNTIEHEGLDILPGRPWPADYGDEPALADYPEIFEVGVRFYGRRSSSNGVDS